MVYCAEAVLSDMLIQAREGYQYFLFMEYKGVKYQNKMKKVRSAAITDYESLRATVQKSYPKDLKSEFLIYYFDDGEPYDVQNQDDYEMMVENPRVITLYVRNKGEQPLSIHSNDVSILSSHISNVLNESIKEESQRLVDAIEEKSTKKQDQNPILTESAKEPTQRQRSKLQQKSMTTKIEEINQGHEIKPQKQQTSIESSQNQISLNKIKLEQSIASVKSSQPSRQPQKKHVVSKKKAADQSVVHKGIRCKVCQTLDIKGSKWKCLDIAEYDICNDCYAQQKYKSTKEHKNKNYRFIQINDLDFDKRVNYCHTIRKVFDPLYKIPANDPIIGQWISEEDISECKPNFVRELWKCSATIAKKTLSKFDEWEKSYESMSAKQ